MQRCTKCNTTLPDHAKFCLQCGQAVGVGTSPDDHTAFIDFEQNIEKQLGNLFFKILESTVKSEQNATLSKTYAERVYTTGFRDILDVKIPQLATRIKNLPPTGSQLEKIVTQEMEQLIDFFLIHHCNDINKIQLPETILKHQHTSIDKSIIYPVVLDYLDFSNEKETVYLDFSTMPARKFKNATQAYLTPTKLEKILFICDQSILGNGKSGFAMTDTALYWKNPYKQPVSIPYNTLKSIQKTEDWITINGHFFNASPSLNLKMLRLLKKLSP